MSDPFAELEPLQPTNGERWIIAMLDRIEAKLDRVQAMIDADHLILTGIADALRAFDE